MLGLGLSLTTGGVISSPAAILVAAFKSRVIADGGTVESPSCAKSDVKFLLDNPEPSAFDTDAQAFITAASITDSTQQSAIDTLVVDLKTAGVWTKMKAIYPVVGGTASSHKFNLKDPRDLDTAFRLTFSSGWTHSSTGTTPNGTSAYADTNLNLLSNYDTSFDNHFSVYYRTSNVVAEKIGASGSDYRYGMTTHITYTNGNTYNDNMGRNQISNATYGTSAAHHLSSLLSTTSQKLYRNGVLKLTGNADGLATYPSASFYLGAYNNNNVAPNFFSNRELSLATIGDGLNDTESSDLYDAVQAFQTTLGRQV